MPILDCATAGDPAHASALAGADLIYLSGVNPRHPIDTLGDRLTWAGAARAR